MFEDDDFSLFDDKQVEQLNAVEEPAGGDAPDPVTPAANDDASGEDDPNKGTDDKSELGGEDTPEAVKAAEEAAAKKAEEDKAEADRVAAEEAEAELAKDETPEQTEARHKQEADDKAAAEAAAAAEKKDEEKEKFATKDDIRAALAEQAALAEAQQTTRKTFRNELRKELFPEGIDVDLKIKDSDNGIITGPSQIAGKLINPNTQELFTYEEAKDYWDNAQKQIDIAIEQREQLIDQYAENSQSFFEGSQKVEAKYGEWLKKNPVEAKKLLDNFLKTAKVTKSGYITEMPLDVEAYYDTALGPVTSVASQLELQKQGEEAKKAAEAEKKNNQSDRADLPVNSNTPPPKKKDELSSAFDRYFEGK